MTRTLSAWMLLVLALSGSDVAGWWSGSFDVFAGGKTGKQLVYMNLLRRGSEITGTAGPHEDAQWPVANGKIAGDRITFEVRPPEGSAVRFYLRFVDDVLQGEARARRDGRLYRARVKVTREIV